MIFFFLQAALAALLLYKGFFKIALVVLGLLLLFCLWNFFFHMTTSLEVRW